MNIKGKVERIFEKQVFDSGFVKREILVKTEDAYPQLLKVEFAKDKVELLNKLSIGQDVEVAVNIRGSEYKDKFYVSLHGWKIDVKSEGQIDDMVQIGSQAQAGYGDGLPF